MQWACCMWHGTSVRGNDADFQLCNRFVLRHVISLYFVTFCHFSNRLAILVAALSSVSSNGQEIGLLLPIEEGSNEVLQLGGCGVGGQRQRAVR
jgi:hypothetical protein